MSRPLERKTLDFLFATNIGLNKQSVFHQTCKHFWVKRNLGHKDLIVRGSDRDFMPHLEMRQETPRPCGKPAKRIKGQSMFRYKLHTQKTYWP